MSKPRVLTENEIKALVNNLPEWKYLNNHIEASFDFADFDSAFNFISEIAAEAKAMDHHPAWSNSYSYVEISLSTHSVGDKVTDLDVEMAKFISRAALKQQTA